MRFGPKETTAASAKRWTRVFAFVPVWIDGTGFVWLEEVDQRWNPHGGDFSDCGAMGQLPAPGAWEFRLPTDPA